MARSLTALSLLGNLGAASMSDVGFYEIGTLEKVIGRERQPLDTLSMKIVLVRLSNTQRLWSAESLLLGFTRV